MARRKQNTQWARDRKKLVEDFERRVRFSEEAGDARNILRRPRSIAWVVHPTADETELLAELGMRPSECESADAYWRYGDSAYFVEFRGCDDPWARAHRQPPGVYYLFDKLYRCDQFEISLPRPVVASTDLHSTFDVLEAFIDRGRIEAARRRLRVRDTKTRFLGPVYLGEVP